MSLEAGKDLWAAGSAQLPPKSLRRLSNRRPPIHLRLSLAQVSRCGSAGAAT